MTGSLSCWLLHTDTRRTACPSSKYPSLRPSPLRRWNQVELDLVSVQDLHTEIDPTSETIMLLLGIERHNQWTRCTMESSDDRSWRPLTSASWKRSHLNFQSKSWSKKGRCSVSVVVQVWVLPTAHLDYRRKTVLGSQIQQASPGWIWRPGLPKTGRKVL